MSNEMTAEQYREQYGQTANDELAKLTKYRNVKTEVDGIKFDSKAEARRYGELKMLLDAGEISDVSLQPRFRLLVNNELICVYVADFAYQEEPDGDMVVEDVKSPATKTAVYRLKKKLMKACLGIDIVEVSA